MHENQTERIKKGSIMKEILSMDPGDAYRMLGKVKSSTPYEIERSGAKALETSELWSFLNFQNVKPT